MNQYQRAIDRAIDNRVILLSYPNIIGCAVVFTLIIIRHISPTPCSPEITSRKPYSNITTHIGIIIDSNKCNPWDFTPILKSLDYHSFPFCRIVRSIIINILIVAIIVVVSQNRVWIDKTISDHQWGVRVIVMNKNEATFAVSSISPLKCLNTRVVGYRCNKIALHFGVIRIAIMNIININIKCFLEAEPTLVNNGDRYCIGSLSFIIEPSPRLNLKHAIDNLKTCCITAT